jgi:NTP pyrophosphatase (non-canonical NTP hydrolase)
MGNLKEINIIPAIRKWLMLSGTDKPDSPQLLSAEDKKFHASLIEEEVNELLHALRENDVTEICDGIFDSLWVINQLAMVQGMNIYDILRAGIESNMSKFCKTEQEAIDTVTAYHNGTHSDKMGISINVIYEQVGELFVIKRYNDGKTMKSINFKQPDFTCVTSKLTETSIL